MFNKKLILGFMLLFMYSVNAIGLSTNVLHCNISDNPNLQGYGDKLLSFISNNPQILDNAHVSSPDKNGNLYLYCKATDDEDNIVADISSQVFQKDINNPTQHCGGDLSYYLILDLSSDENAHVEDPLHYDNFQYEWCLSLTPKGQSNPVLDCYISDTGSCDNNYLCIFKFTGKAAPDVGEIYTNAHVYDCSNTNIANNQYATLCCALDPNYNGNVITQVQYDSSSEEIYLLLGLEKTIPVLLYNPTDVPLEVTLYLTTQDNIFQHYIWLGDRADIYSPSPNTKKIILEPRSKKVVNINIFAGKVGTYNINLDMSVQGNDRRNIFSTNVTIIPSINKGRFSKSPEGNFIYYFLAILLLVMFSMFKRKDIKVRI